MSETQVYGFCDPSYFQTINSDQKTKYRGCCRSRNLIFPHPPAPRKSTLGVNIPGPAVPDPGSRSRKKAVPVPGSQITPHRSSYCHQQALSSRRDSPPPIYCFCAQSGTSSFLTVGSLQPQPQISQRVPTWRHGGRRRPPEVPKLRAAIADAAFTAARGCGGSVGGLGQLRLGGQTAPGLSLRPACDRGTVCGEEAG